MPNSALAQGNRMGAPTPSPGIPGEGWGEGSPASDKKDPHPNPSTPRSPRRLVYRARESGAPLRLPSALAFHARIIPQTRPLAVMIAAVIAQELGNVIL